MSLSKLFKTYPHIFITGTDTEVGKTYCSAVILRQMQNENLSVFPFKPISAGTIPIEQTSLNKVEIKSDLFEQGAGSSVNEDAAALYQATNGKFDLNLINPIVFDEPIAPHLAAQHEGRLLNKQLLDVTWANTQKKIKGHTDFALIEGAGGWLLPLNNDELLSEWVAEQNLPVVLVVGIKLGCLNHALLTAQAVIASGCRLVGWVANFIEPESPVGRENVNYLKTQLKRQYDVDCILEVPRG